jgi:hypothetical protein
MAIVLTVNGTPFSFPESNDVFWGQSVTDWAAAISNGLLQKAGGSFSLQSEVDFGFGYGLKSFYYKTKSSNIASSGQFRLARPDNVTWRNSSNDSDLHLSVNEEDRLVFNNVPINSIVQNISSDVQLTVADSLKIFLVDTSLPRSITLPSPSSLLGMTFTFKDISGLASSHPISLIRSGTEKIEGSAETYVLSINRGAWTLVSDGTDWHII